MKNLEKIQKNNGISYIAFVLSSLLTILALVIYFYVHGIGPDTWSWRYKLPWILLAFSVCSLLIFSYELSGSYPFFPTSSFDSSCFPAIAVALNGKELFLKKIERNDIVRWEKSYDISFSYDGKVYKIRQLSEQYKNDIEEALKEKDYFILYGKSKVPGKQFGVEVEISIA